MLNVEFHLHTKHSFDGFNSYTDIIEECKKKNIDVVAFTDHDNLALTEFTVNHFKSNGIQIIPGCEFTTDNGAHIIGLFIKKFKRGLSLTELMQFIKNQNGIICIPHPFKGGNGFFDKYAVEDKAVQDFLKQSALIELNNGGWNSFDYQDEIKRIADKYNLKLVAGSDAHKPWQIGYYINQYDLVGSISKEDLRNIEPRILELELEKKVEKRTNEHKYFKSIRGNNFFMKIKKIIPFKLRQDIKKICTYPSVFRKKRKQKKNKIKYHLVND